MIDIKRIYVRGYKNIDDVEINLDKMTSILSTNNYGKSNLLSAIDFGIKFIKQNENDKEKYMHNRSISPLNRHIKERIFTFEIQFLTKIDNEETDIIYGYSFMWPNKYEEQGKINKEYLKVKKIDESQKHAFYMKRENKKSYYKPSKTGACDKQVKIEDNELLINKLKYFDSLFYNEIIDLINNFQIFINKYLYVNEDFYTMSNRKSALSNSLHQGDLIKNLIYIKNKDVNKYEKLINAYKSLFPTMEEIDIDTFMLPEKITKNLSNEEEDELSNELKFIYAKDKNLLQNVIFFSSMSDGAKRVLMILTYLTKADIDGVPLVAIEEPENSVHPKLLYNYLYIINSLVENSKILITSHSPYLINYINTLRLYIGIPNEKGLAKFSKIKESAKGKIEKQAGDMNILSGEYIFDLMCGSSDDIETLMSYLED